MDSLSQFALGAAVAHVVVGKQLGPRALLLGGALGTLPDLDVIFPMGGAIADYSYHRSWSHSLLVHAAVTAPLACLLRRGCFAALSFPRMCGAVFLVLATHALLDACTIYGTQLVWPLPGAPMGLGSIFIIDPLYTLPLLVGILTAWRSRERAQRWNRLGLGISTAYLFWSIGAQQWTRSLAEQDLARRGIEPSQLLVTAAPFNTFLWRMVAIDGDRYLEGFDSLLDGAPPDWYAYPRHSEVVASLPDSWAMQRVDWFTKGAWAASSVDDGLILTDLRMGMEPSYVFRFRVAERDGQGVWQEVPERLQQVGFRSETLGWVWHRIFSAIPKPDATALPALAERQP
jgi:inner membrane protein